MIADALRVEVEAHVERTRAGNRLFRLAQEGRVAPGVLARYLASVRYSIAQTPRMLTRARRSASAHGQGELARHFANKLADEAGHDRWADADVEVLAAHRAVRYAGRPEAAVVELYAFLEETVDREPALYLAYVLWAAYFTVLAGADFARAIVERCGMPAEAITSVSRHAELDREHTIDGLDAIDRLVQDPARLAPMRATMRTSMALFDRMCDEILDDARGLAADEQRVAG
jgi:hypothetical protein